ncbi:MAG: LURP-one-related family protein [Oscillospiraceae bacterium]|nr:LURP-one-related family protein [Oscillospiraceae bacterium]
MRLFIRQRIFSWTDSYDVYNEEGEACYEVRAKFFALGHQIQVYDKHTGREMGAIREKLFTILPQFEIVIGGKVMGTVRKELTFFKENYRVDYRGWNVDGDVFGWDYRVMEGRREVMSIQKEIFRLSDTYALEFHKAEDELPGLLLVIAIDAANCSRNKN